MTQSTHKLRVCFPSASRMGTGGKTCITHLKTMSHDGSLGGRRGGGIIKASKYAVKSQTHKIEDRSLPETSRATSVKID